MKRILVGLLLILDAVLVLLLTRQWATTQTVLDVAPSDDAILVERVITQTPVPATATSVPVVRPEAKTNASKTVVLPTVVPTQTPTPEPAWAPERLVISSLKIDAPIVSATEITVKYQGEFYRQWAAPNSESVGWLPTSSTLGLPGNTAMISHDNGGGHVFAHLSEIKIGDLITVYSGSKAFNYVVTANAKLPEQGQPLSVKLQNAAWAGPFPDERLTLITCWPPWGSTYRIVVIARPLGR